ncbi:ion transporter [Gulosibacter faecalis]|jgi:voltage-gated sodium channel|uniref:Ion transporter n=1 Tax=Gulosibacter faecalis TaxID=272240 RepID=A0ABW5V1L7_9MICO|nr:ion transporter [Gulosibacter faecalis]
MRTDSSHEPWPPNPHATGIRRRIGEFVLHPTVQNFVIVVIIVNAVALGLETSDAVMARVGGLLHALDLIALGIFVVELAAKMFALGRAFWRDGWNVFDFLVVAIALIPASGPLAVLRSLRVLRVLRLINRMPQLRRIADAIIKAIPGIGAIAALMAIIFYVGSVMATVLFGDTHPEMFGSIPASLLTLFQVMTLDSWALGVVVPVMAEHPTAWMFFIPFILVSAFVMLNLFIAVIVDTMSNLGRDEKPTKLEHPLFHADSELARVHAELAEIKALLKEHPAPRD